MRRSRACCVHLWEGSLSHSTSSLSSFDSTYQPALSGLDFVFHMFFLLKYSKSLEEGACVVVVCGGVCVCVWVCRG